MFSPTNSITLKTLIPVRINFYLTVSFSNPHNINFMKKYSIIIFILGLSTLLLIQSKVVMPFVYKVIQSDIFLVDSKDQGGQAPISNQLTNIAYMHCNTYIKSKLGPDISISFPEKPINAWSLGNYQYVINAEIDISNPTTNSATKKYVCRINYKNGDNEEGSLDYNNWSIDGLSGLDDI